jgi:hypothetical protein
MDAGGRTRRNGWPLPARAAVPDPARAGPVASAAWALSALKEGP